MAITKEIKITADTQGAKKSVDELNQNIEKTNETSKELSSGFDKLTGGAVSKFKGLITSIKGVAIGFKGVGAAIAASGLGLLVITIAAIGKAFTASEEGQNKFAKIMGVIGSITGNLIDLLSDFGELVISVFENPQKAINDLGKIIKQNIINRFEGLMDLIPALGTAIGLLFEGKFKEAGKVAADAVGKVTTGIDSITEATQRAIDKTGEFIAELQREAEVAAQIADQRAKADKIERSLIVERAEADKKIAELREIAARQDLYSIEQRKVALTEAARINTEIAEKEISAAILRRDAIIEENKLSKSNKEALDAEEEAKAAVIRLDTQRLQLQKRLGTELSSINQQQANAARKAYEESLKRPQVSAVGGVRNETFDLDTDPELIFEEKKAKRLADADSELTDVLIANAQRELDEKERLANLKRDLEENTQNLLYNLSKEGSNLRKALAIKDIVKEQVQSVSAIISNTAAANAAAAAASPLTLGQPFVTLNTIAGGLGIAASVTGAAAAIKDIVSEKKTVSGGGVNLPSGGGGGVSAPSFNLVEGTGSNQIASGLGRGRNPVRAYVVSGDVTSGQELDRNIQGDASLG